MYLIWTINNHYKLFKSLNQAKKYCNNLKVEAYINVNLDKLNEDTIYGNNKK